MRGGAREGVPLPRPGARPQHARRRDQPERRDDGHARGGAPRAQQKARVLAVTNTVGSTIPRESDAVLYTRAGPEVAVASTKAFITQVAAMYLVGLYLAQVRGTRDADEVARPPAPTCRRCPTSWRRCSPRMEPVRALAREIADGRPGAVPRPPRRLPDGARGRAQAQGALLRARRGLPGRRDQARADRARRPGHARRRRRAARPPCTASSSATSRRCARAGPARSWWSPTEDDDVVAPYADHLIRVPRHQTLLAPLVTIVPLQVLSAARWPGARPRRRPAAQPREVGHRRVTVLLRRPRATRRGGGRAARGRGPRRCRGCPSCRARGRARWVGRVLLPAGEVEVAARSSACARRARRR